MREKTGRGRAARDAVGAEARGGERVARLAQQLVDGLQSLGERRILGPAVAGVAADTGDLDRGQPRELLRDGERTCRGRLTGAVEADVELDEERGAETAACEDPSEPFGRRGAVDRDGQVDARGRDVGEPLPLVGSERRVVNEDPRRARLPEDLGLTGLGNRQTGSAELELPAADLRGLVGLRVGPELDPVRVDVRLHVLEVRVEPVEVDHGDRRFDLAQRPADLVLEQLESARRSGRDLDGWTSPASHCASIDRAILRRMPW